MRPSRFSRHAGAVLWMLSPLAHASAVGDPPTILAGYPIVEIPVFDGTPTR